MCLFVWLCRVLVVTREIFSFGMWSQLWHVGSSSLTRDRTRAPLHWDRRVLATGPPGSSQNVRVLKAGVVGTASVMFVIIPLITHAGRLHMHHMCVCVCNPVSICTIKRMSTFTTKLTSERKMLHRMLWKMIMH